jgi:catechol 2,3-dioxygenase-like lactoylglutathione lyase family enzyme
VFDHVTLRVPDLAAAERRFQRLFDQLSYDETLSNRSLAMWEDFIITAADREHELTARAAIAFAAPSEEAASDFRRVALEAGLTEEGGALLDEAGNTFAAVVRRGNAGGHVVAVTMRVADLAATTRFYEAVAQPAGHDLRDGSLTFVQDDAPTAGLHLAFAGDDDAVRRFFSAGTAAGGRPNGGPGERAVYHPGYFASYVLDPGGNNIEVVNHHRG